MTRLLLYGTAATGIAIAGTLVYANYNPAFRSKVDAYVPGFAATSDFAADRYVDLVDYVSSKRNPGSGKDLRVQVVVEPPKEDPFQRLARRKEREKERETDSVPSPTAEATVKEASGDTVAMPAEDIRTETADILPPPPPPTPSSPSDPSPVPSMEREPSSSTPSSPASAEAGKHEAAEKSSAEVVTLSHTTHTHAHAHAHAHTHTL